MVRVCTAGVVWCGVIPSLPQVYRDIVPLGSALPRRANMEGSTVKIGVAYVR